MPRSQAPLCSFFLDDLDFRLTEGDKVVGVILVAEVTVTAPLERLRPHNHYEVVSIPLDDGFRIRLEAVEFHAVMPLPSPVPA